MGGFFGTVLKSSCARDLFYGVDYHSHLGTKRAGMVTHDGERFYRSIHDIENTYFRTKFSDELGKFLGNNGIGVISDTDAQPIIVNSHLGKFAITTVAKINNLDELVNHCLENKQHFAELSSGYTNPTELVALLITQGEDFVDGIKNVFDKVKGSCSMLILTEDGIIAARDYYGRTPIVVGKSEDGRLYDRFRDRVIFPIFTVSGKPVAFAGRILKKKDNVGKYVNSPDSIIYSKTNELYGLYQAKQSIARLDMCYLVEGQMDVISMHQSGVENVVASGGTALTKPQIWLIKRFTSNITVLYDGDAAGIHAALRGIDMFLEAGFNVKVVLLPDGEDPDSMRFIMVKGKLDLSIKRTLSGSNPPC